MARGGRASPQSRCEPGESVIKLILSRGVEHGPAPTAWVTAARAADFAQARARGIRVVTLDRGYDSGAPARAPWLLLGAKTLSYAVNMAAIREAKRRGADDAIFVSSDGIVLEAPTASAHPALRRPLRDAGADRRHPAGHDAGEPVRVPRAQGLATAYETSRRRRCTQADAAWLVSSVRLAAPITEIDGIGARDRRGASRHAFNRYLLSPRD